MKHEETDVLVVGLGPVGAALTVYLGRSGVRTIAIERDTGVYPLPRAAHLDHETMRLLHLAGGAEAVAKASQPLSAYEFRNGAGELLMGFRPEGEIAPTGWPTSSMFHQPTLEHALRARLDEIPCVSARLGHALTTYNDSDGRVVATVAGPDGAYEIAARFIVGCDGGNSVVRRVAGITLDDLGFDEPWLVIDTTLKNGVERLSTIGLQHCDPARPVTSMPMAPGRHRWEFMLLPSETAEEVMSDARLTAMLAPFVDPASIAIERRAVYRFHALVAQRWRSGSILLAGDAAHQMPPFMGQGLCSGVRDAANLAWKIDAVLSGRAHDALLDSYQPEREPHVRMITNLAMMMGKVVCTQDIEAARARDEDMLAQPEATRVSAMLGLDGLKFGILESGGAVFADPLLNGGRLDDAAGYAAILVVRAECDASRAFAASGGFVARFAALEDRGGHLAAAIGDAAALLVRPDRYIFGTGDAASLLEEWHAYLASGRTSTAA